MTILLFFLLSCFEQESLIAKFSKKGRKLDIFLGESISGEMNKDRRSEDEIKNSLNSRRKRLVETKSDTTKENIADADFKDCLIALDAYSYLLEFLIYLESKTALSDEEIKYKDELEKNLYLSYPFTNSSKNADKNLNYFHGRIKTYFKDRNDSAKDKGIIEESIKNIISKYYEISKKYNETEEEFEVEIVKAEKDSTGKLENKTEKVKKKRAIFSKQS